MSPIELMQTRRLLLAKQLLTETKLPVTEIAFASGFSSLRRFNDAFGTQYRMPPTHLRKRAAEDHETIDAGRTSTLRLSYRPPYDWEEILKFLGARMIRDVEFVTADSYARTVRLGQTHRLDQGHARARKARARSRVHAHACAGPAGVVRQAAQLVRPHGAAGSDRGAFDER